MEDREILDCITGLVAEERHLRDARDNGSISEEVELRRLEQLEHDLDQLWDTLRRRRAMRSAGLDPDLVEQRPSLQVEAYVQ